MTTTRGRRGTVMLLVGSFGLTSGFRISSGVSTMSRRPSLVTVALAPRAELVTEFEQCATISGRLGLDAAASVGVIAELLEEGSLAQEELEKMWRATDGLDDSQTLGVDGFVSLCGEIDELFEEDEEEEEVEIVVAEEALSEVGAIRARIVALIPPAGECELHDVDNPEDDADLIAACTEIGEFPPDFGETSRLLCGEWELAWTSSPSFAFNGGFTGVGRTTPGGGEFMGLRQSIAPNGLSDYTETIELSVAQTLLDVNVSCDWGLQSRTDVISLIERTHLECTPRRVQYGLLSVEGKRVTNGWKTMRVLNGLALAYLDDTLRVQRGNTRNTWFVWRRIS